MSPVEDLLTEWIEEYPEEPERVLAIWKSLPRSVRGNLKTRQDFADFMGVSRQNTYDWEKRAPVDEWVTKICWYQWRKVAEEIDTTKIIEQTHETGLNDQGVK